MRKEKRAFYEMQIKILALFVTTCGIALGAIASSLEAISEISVILITVVVVPAFITFFAIIWID